MTSLTSIYRQLDELYEQIDELRGIAADIVWDIKQYDEMNPRDKLPKLQELAQKYRRDPEALVLIDERISDSELWIQADDAWKRTNANWEALTKAVFAAVSDPDNALDIIQKAYDEEMDLDD